MVNELFWGWGKMNNFFFGWFSKKVFCAFGLFFFIIIQKKKKKIDRFESLHHANFVHRDVKPGNFLIGTHQQSNIVYGKEKTNKGAGMQILFLKFFFTHTRC